jgi:hypothetical protein
MFKKNYMNIRYNAKRKILLVLFRFFFLALIELKTSIVLNESADVNKSAD